MKISKKSTFFIMVEKGADLHSSMSVGYLDVLGNPKRLIKLGKYADIDDYNFFPNFLLAPIIYLNAVFPGVSIKAYLCGENLTSIKGGKISYQAYEISFSQYLELVELCATLYENQIDNYDIRNKVKNGKYIGDQRGKEFMISRGIQGFAPQKEAPKKYAVNMNDSINLEYGMLNRRVLNAENPSPFLNNKVSAVSKRCFNLALSNTCRTTAIDLMDAIAGVGSQVGFWFASALDYTITANYLAVLPGAAFYILPMPPSAYEACENKTTKIILNEIYTKLRNIPKHNPTHDNTRKKFDALCLLYKEIAGQPKTMTLETLLTKITDNQNDNKEVIEKFRNFGWGKNFFNSKTSTQRLYEKITKQVSTADLSSKNRGPLI